MNIKIMNAELKKHCEDVSIIAKNIATELDMSLIEVEEVRLAALYHDIGKMYIPDTILNKHGKLTEAEQLVVRNHTYIGYMLLDDLGPHWSDVAANVALYHHENVDGSGYYGKQLDEIYFAAYIVRVADVYSALTTERVYHSAWTHSEAVKYIEENTETIFDWEVVNAFLKLANGQSAIAI